MKNTVKINENTLRKIVAESVKKALSEIINPFDDGFGGVDTAMAASYSNKNIGDAWLKKAGMRRDMLQGGKPVPNNKEEENESKINESALRKIVAESMKKVLKEDTAYQMGRGEVSVDAAYQRIDKALDALRHIADTMSDNGYYETEESALRSQINYIEQEMNYIRNH